MGKLDQIIQQFRNEIGENFISMDVVGKDGMSIGGGSIDPKFNSTDAPARFSMVMDLASKASGKVGMGRVEENLTTTDKAYIIARFIGDGSYFWELAVTRSASLGAVRMTMNEFAARLWDAIPR